MKPKTRLASINAMDENLNKLKKLLAESEYNIFSPSNDLAIKKGFVALNWLSKPTMVAKLVLVRSRGSFLEVRFDDIHSSEALLLRLRKLLWVPIYVGETIKVEDAYLKDLILDGEHSEFDTLRKGA